MGADELILLLKEIKQLRDDYTYSFGKARRKERRVIKLKVNQKIDIFNKALGHKAINKL